MTTMATVTARSAAVRTLEPPLSPTAPAPKSVTKAPIIAKAPCWVSPIDRLRHSLQRDSSTVTTLRSLAPANMAQRGPSAASTASTTLPWLRGASLGERTVLTGESTSEHAHEARARVAVGEVQAKVTTVECRVRGAKARGERRGSRIVERTKARSARRLTADPSTGVPASVVVDGSDAHAPTVSAVKKHDACAQAVGAS